MNRLRDSLICLSFANLCFLDVWDKAGSHWWHYLRGVPLEVSLAGLIAPPLLAVLSVAAVLWVGLAILRSTRNILILRAAKWGALFLFLLPLNVMRLHGLGISTASIIQAMGRPGPIIIAVVVVVAAVILVFRNNSIIVKAPAVICLILAPLIPIQVGRLIWTHQRLPPSAAYLDQAPARLVPVKPGTPRIVWLVFDEMDQQLVFPARPSSLELPELDRLRREAIYAEHTYSAGLNTKEALAALISGRRVQSATPVSPNEWQITFEGEQQPVRWSQQPSLFTKARVVGVNTALVGHFIPYCRIMGSALADCYWRQSGLINSFSPQLSAHEQVYKHLASRPQQFPYLGQFARSQGWVFSNPAAVSGMRRDMIEDYIELRKRFMAVLTDTRFQLVLLHLSVPHPPDIYNRETGELSADDRITYFDNVALADRTLGDFRRELERTDQWDRTILLVTSDHALRPPWADPELEIIKQHREIPFLLKLSGQQAGITYASAFNALLIHELMLELLQGSLASTQSVVSWLDRCRSRFPLEPPAAPMADSHTY